MISFRKKHSIVKSNDEDDYSTHTDNGYPRISWHGTRAWNADFSGTSRVLAMLCCGKNTDDFGNNKDDFVNTAMNMHWETHVFELLKLPDGYKWHVFANTDVATNDICEIGHEVLIDNQNEFLVGPRSVVILVGK
jgi:glycogen operon protein